MNKEPLERAQIAADLIVLTVRQGKPSLLLVKRKNEPFKDHWALPGGMVNKDEPLKKAAERELEEETGLRGINFQQAFAVGTPGRDPRGRVVSIVYWGKIKNPPQLRPSSDAREAKWFSLDQLPELAFDHQEIIERIVKLLPDNLFGS